MEENIQKYFHESASVINQSRELLARPIAEAAGALFSALENNGKVLACGNGGSAAEAQHFSAELVGRFERDRPGLAAIALTTDSSILTAVANDYDFSQIFARQVRALGQPGDVLLALSTSGDSANVLAAIEEAHEREMRVIALTGREGGQVGSRLCGGDFQLCVPGENTARIQEVHLLILHCLCNAVDTMLLGE